MYLTFLEGFCLFALGGSLGAFAMAMFAAGDDHTEIDQ